MPSSREPNQGPGALAPRRAARPQKRGPSGPSSDSFCPLSDGFGRRLVGAVSTVDGDQLDPKKGGGCGFFVVVSSAQSRRDNPDKALE